MAGSRREKKGWRRPVSDGPDLGSVVHQSVPAEAHQHVALLQVEGTRAEHFEEEADGHEVKEGLQDTGPAEESGRLSRHIGKLRRVDHGALSCPIHIQREEKGRRDCSLVLA